MRYAVCCWVVALAAIILMGCGVEQAQAACFYNYAGGDAYVFYDCTMGRYNNWIIHPGGKKCRPGLGGKATVYTYSKNGGPNSGNCKVHVESDGWVSIGWNEGHLYVHSKDKHGDIIENCHSDLD